MIISFKLPDENVELKQGKNGETILNLKFDTDKVILMFKTLKNKHETENAISVNYDRQTGKFKVGTI